MPIQALQWTEFLSCPVCCNDFDWNSRVPVSLGCGHTICNKCLKNLHKKQCPLDQNTINTDVDKLPINEALLQLIEKNNTNENNLQVFVSPLSQEFQSQNDYQDYLKSKKCIEELARYLKPRREEGGEVSFVSRPIHRKLVTLISCQLIEPSGRSRAIRTSRSIGERCVTELILYHQNPQQLSSNLWTAVRSRGCQFLGPEMQEQVLKLILLALEDGSALSRKVLVMFVVQRLEPHYPQASKTSIGHVVQLLYRASCFKVLKRENDSALMELKNLYTNYEALRREHDAQIVQIAIDSGLRIAPDQWSALLYGDGNHKSHMQSIIDKLQTSQSFSQSINELFIYLQRSKCSNNNFINDMRENLELLASIDCGKNQGTKVDESVNNNNWPETRAALEAVKEVVEAYVKFFKRDGENRCVHSEFYKAHYYHHHYYHHHHLHHHHYHHHHHLLHRNNQQQNESVVNSNNMFRGSCPHTTNCNFIHSNFEIDHQRKRNQILQVGGIAEDSVGMSDDEGGIDEKKKIQGGDMRQFYHHHHQVCHYGNENNEILSISVKKDKSITKKLQILVQRKAVMIEQLEKLKIDGAS